SIPFPEGPPAFRILQTTVFQSPSMTDFETTAFLGDVKTHSVDSRTGKISFFQPWANSSFTPNEWERLEMIGKTYFMGFNQTVRNIIQALNFSSQSLLFSEIQPNRTTRTFYNAAGNGEALVTFSAATHWAAQRKDKTTVYIANVLNQDKGTTAILESLFPQFVKMVSWLQDDQEMPDSSMVNSTQILPNHDLTYQIRSSLEIPSADTHSYSCKVEHSSLGGKSLVIPWENTRASAEGHRVSCSLEAALNSKKYENACSPENL
ncbi:hypothetical protein lerEdw1_015503, partial [Lerista edwardsae]